MKFIKNHWYSCLHDCIIKRECIFSKGHLYKCIESNILKGNNDEQIHLNDFDVNWDYYFNLAVTPIDNVNHPKHYSYLKELCGIEVIDITRHMDFNIGQILKYILRLGYKNDSNFTNYEKILSDLYKAEYYLTREIDRIDKLCKNNGNH